MIAALHAATPQRRNASTTVEAALHRSAPNFVALSTFGEIELYAWLGGRRAMILFSSETTDTTSPTLLEALGALSATIDREQIALLAVSTATLEQLLEWLDLRRRSHLAAVDCPLVADPEGVISEAIGLPRPHCCVVEIALDRTIVAVHPFPGPSRVDSSSG